jgi:hypothetical protein
MSSKQYKKDKKDNIPHLSLSNTELTLVQVRVHGK